MQALPAMFFNQPLFLLPFSCRRLHYGSPCSLSSQLGLSHSFPLVLQCLAQGKVTNLKDFTDAFNLILILKF